MTRLLIGVLLAAALSGCTVDAPPSATPTGSPAGMPLPSPSASSVSSPVTSPTASPVTLPTAGPPSPAAPTDDGAAALLPEIVRWHVVGDAIHVELFNPNHDVGLLRADFSIDVLGPDGAVFATLGLSGLPGTPASTILQLPPRGTYGLVDFLPAQPPPIASLELSILAGQWMDWQRVSPPAVEVRQPELGVSGNRPRVSGQLEVIGGEGKFNVWVLAFIEAGETFVVADGVANCIAPGTPASFQVDALSDLSNGVIGRIVAYVTTVPGVPGSADGLDSPPGC